jgi:hypothetical protein
LADEGVHVQVAEVDSAETEEHPEIAVPLDLKVTEPGVLTVAVITTAVPYVPVEALAGKLKVNVGVIFEIAEVFELVAEALPPPLVTVIVADIALPTSSVVNMYVDAVAPEIGVPSRFQAYVDVGAGIPVTPLADAVNV